MEQRNIITPIHFVDKYEDTKLVRKEVIKETVSDESEFTFKCKYGSINVKLSKIPFLRHIL